MTYEMQAEEAQYSSGGVENNHDGYTGTGFVNTDNAADEWIEWSIEVADDCNATCVLRYACASDARPMDLSINGSFVTNLGFPASGAWAAWTTETADVILYSGVNTICLTATASGGAPNMDKMDITIYEGEIITPTPSPVPTPAPTTGDWSVQEFRNLKYGMFIHFSLSTFDGKEQTPGSTTSVDIYNPTNLDVDQWIRVTSDSGMRYAVFTSKHSSGFCLWDSKVQWEGSEFAYDVGASPVKTDVTAGFMTACAKYNIVPGLYYCTMDTRHSHTSIDWTPSQPYISAEYEQLMKDHLTELHTNYPGIKIQWIDIPRHLTSNQRTTFYNLVKSINPECLVMYNYGQESRDIDQYTIEVAMDVTWPTDIFNSEKNLIGEPFETTQVYNGTTYELAYEHCISITDYWFWKPDESLKFAGSLIDIRQDTWDFNGNFLLNVPPDNTGQIPEATIRRLSEIK